MEVYKNCLVEFKRTRNRYRILSTSVLMKNPETREWIKSVVYKQESELGKDGTYIPIPEDSKLTFVREFNDFNEKFEIVVEF